MEVNKPNSCLLLLFFLLGCASQNMTWHDLTGNGRGTARLNMDYASCQQIRESVPATITKGYCPACALINAGTTITNRDNAFNNCMEARGWEQAPTSASPPAVSYAASSPPHGFVPVPNASLQICCSDHGGLALDKYDGRICSNAHLLCADDTPSLCGCGY